MSSLQASAQFRARGETNREEIVNGQFPPKRRAQLKPPNPQPIEDVAVGVDPYSGGPISRTSIAADTDSRIHGPDVVFDNRLAAFSEQHDGMQFPDEEDILAFSKPQASLPGVPYDPAERALLLSQVRTRRRGHADALNSFFAWQLEDLIRDQLGRADDETREARETREHLKSAPNLWFSKQHTHLRRRQLNAWMKLKEMEQMREFRILKASAKPRTPPSLQLQTSSAHGTAPSPSTALPQSSSAQTILDLFARPPRNRADVLSGGGIPVNRMEFEGLSENDKYSVALWLSADGSSAFRKAVWSQEDEAKLLRIYENDVAFQNTVRDLLDSKTTRDPRRRR